MEKTTKAAIVSVILAVIGLGAGGAVYNLDFSTNSSQTNTDNSVSSGDTITNYITENIVEQALDNEAIYDIGEEIALDIICEGEVVPHGMMNKCADYWCEFEGDYEICIAEEIAWMEENQ